MNVYQKYEAISNYTNNAQENTVLILKKLLEKLSEIKKDFLAFKFINADAKIDLVILAVEELHEMIEDEGLSLEEKKVSENIKNLYVWIIERLIELKNIRNEELITPIEHVVSDLYTGFGGSTY